MILKLKKIFLPLIAGFFYLFCLGTTATAQSNFPRDSLSIKTAETEYKFDIELALDDNHRQYGLMYRDHLPEMSGMLFIYDRARNIAMWMKNTFIPLDIVFIDEAGKIINIAKSAKPRDLSQIPSKGPAKAALELNGGLTDKLGINVGDEILYPTFGNTDK